MYYFNFATDVFDRQAAERPESCALWWVSEDRSREKKFTFAELSDLSSRAAVVFASAGLVAGDRVLLVLPRIPEWWISMLALIRMGAVPITGTPQLTMMDLEYRLEIAEVRAVVTDGKNVEKFRGFHGMGWIVGEEREGWHSLDAALRKPVPKVSFAPTPANAPGVIFFTSSTTGKPKMVLHTQESYGKGHSTTGRLWLDLTENDVHWNTSDLGWAKAAWSSFFGPWNCGACIFVWDSGDRFVPGLVWDMLEEYPISSFCAPPTAYRMLVKLLPHGRLFPSLRHCVTAGEPLSVDVFKVWKESIGLEIYEGYGQTETVAMIAHCSSSGYPVVPGSIGRPIPGYEISLLDEELNEVPVGEEGEIAVRMGPERPVGVFHGYYGNPEQTALQFRGEWYLTGDRASRDAAGYFWFVGRKDDVIKSSGFRIGPHEVEDILLAHPAVQDAAVIGKPDPMRGHIVKAFVVLREGYASDASMVQEVRRHCRRLSAPYKCPREIEFVKELPKTISGKTQRFHLRKSNEGRV